MYDDFEFLGECFSELNHMCSQDKLYN